MEEKIQDIDKRLKRLEDLHRIAIPVVLLVGVIYFITRK